MATTPQGLPYPLPTAPVRAGADDIKALALALDARVPYRAVWGRGGFTTNAYGGIVLTGLPWNIIGAVAITEQNGYACTKSSSTPPAKTAWIDIFSTSNGAIVPNTFIIIDYLIWGA